MKKFFQTWGGVLTTLVLFVVMLTPVLVGAQVQNDNSSNSVFNNNNSNTVSNDNSYTSGRTSILKNPLGGINSICALITKLLQAAIVIGIPIAVLFVVWAGFKFILAQGKMAELQTARRNFLNVVIGIAIFFGASLIAQVILNTLKAFGVSGLNSC